MTPKTQSVCKHCGFGLTFIGHITHHTFEPVAEPASTGEPPPKCTKCGGNLVALPTVHCPKCASTNFLTGAARPSEPSAPQTSAELACQKCVEGIHGHCSGDCECRLSKCNLKVSAPQPVSGDAPIYMTCTECGMNVCDHIVKRLAGDAPQVEEIQRALVRWLEKWELIDNPDANVALRLAMDEIFDEKENADLLAILRPYFPPASQTPEPPKFPNGDLMPIHWCPGLKKFVGYSEWLCSMHKLNSGAVEYTPATPASTARTDGWVSVEERLPKHCNPVEVMAIRFNGEVMRDYSFFCDGEWDGVEDQGYRIKPKIVYWHELLPLPAATGSVPQAAKCNCIAMALSGNGPMSQDCPNPNCQYYSGVPQAEPKEEKP